MRLIHGDALDVLRTLPDGSVDCVVTSPPYAMQRAKAYGGISEKDYPDWTVSWMASAPLSGAGSVLINIREHRNSDGMSDYVHRTRLAVRAAGWCEVDELIWVKPDGMPVAPNSLPRKSWERVLWFSRTPSPFCQPLDLSREVKRFPPTLNKYVERTVGRAAGSHRKPKHPRQRNYVVVANREGSQRHCHPARFPVALASWMARLVCPPGGVVLDPFMGSGTTGVACAMEGRDFVGVEIQADYFAVASQRIALAQKEVP